MTILPSKSTPTCRSQESLDGHVGQLKKYFNLTEVDFAILTNGNEYQFYSDIDRWNTLDDKPFFEFKIHELDIAKDKEIVAYVKGFASESFNAKGLKDQARKFSHKAKISSFLNKELSSPSDKFAKFLSSQIFGTAKNSVKDFVKSSLPEIYSELKDTTPSETTYPKDQRKKRKDEITPPLDPEQEQSPFDIDVLKNTKLEYWRFFNTVTHGRWTDMFVGVLRSLCDEDHEKLVAISASVKRLKITANPSEIVQPHSIGQDLFVSACNSTEVKVELLGIVLSSFGKKDALTVNLK